MGRGSGNCLVFALLLVLTGCAATAATEPPAGAVKFEAAVPAVGTKVVYRITDHQGGGTREETWTVVEASYEKRPVFGISDGVDVRIYDKATGNWIAALRDGKERFSMSPDSGTFSWPLWVGKSWLATFSYYDRVRGRSWSGVQTWWKVAAYEDVTVPAGTFKALRLEASPGTNNATQATLWYAPETGIIVKRIFERTTDHYLGYGKFTTELVKYEATLSGVPLPPDLVLVTLSPGDQEVAGRLKGDWSGTWHADNRSRGRFELKIASVDGAAVRGEGTWHDTVVGTAPFLFSGELKDGGLWISRGPNSWFRLKLYESGAGTHDLRGRYSTVGRGTVYEGDIAVTKRK